MPRCVLLLSPQIMPRVCPNGKSSELLVGRGQKGGSKRSIGAVTTAEAVHVDGRSLHVTVQAAESAERPGRQELCDGHGWGCEVLHMRASSAGATTGLASAGLLEERKVQSVISTPSNCRFLARIIIPRPTSAVTSGTADQLPGGLVAEQRWTAAAAATAGGIMQPAVYQAALAQHAGEAEGGAAAVNPPPGCPFHRAMSGGSSVLQRLGVGGSRPASPGATAAGMVPKSPLVGSGAPADSGAWKRESLPTE